MNGTTAMNGIKLNKTFIKEINENPGELCQCIVFSIYNNEAGKKS